MLVVQGDEVTFTTVGTEDTPALPAVFGVKVYPVPARELVHVDVVTPFAGEVDLVVGSKAMSGAADQRPFVRRLATRTINGMLRVLLGFRGTDTHGLKAFRRDALTRTATRCVVDKDLFASEFVIRAERDGVRVVEIPVSIAEKRPPSIQLTRRVPRVLRDLARLVYVIRIRRS